MTSLRDQARTLPSAALPDFIGDLEAAKAVAWMRLQQAERPTPQQPVELLDASAMAERLSVRKSWLLDLARQGRVPCVRLGRYVRFRPDVIEEWLGRGPCLLPLEDDPK